MRELRRVLFGKTALFMLALLSALSVVLFILSVKGGDEDGAKGLYNEAYRSFIAEYGDRKPEEITEEELDEKLLWIERADSIASHIALIGMDDSFASWLESKPEVLERLNGGYFQRYLAEPLLANAEREAFYAVRRQIEYLKEFNGFYPTIKKNAERMQRTTLFGDPNSFAYRNTIKTVNDFAAIDGAVGRLGDDRAITSVMSDPTADYLILIFMLTVSVLMLKERRSGLWQLVRATPKGRGALAVSRLLTLLAASILAVLLVFASRFIVSYAAFDGLNGSDRLIQSIEGYNGIPFPLKINSFVFLYCGIKLVTAFFAGIIIFFILSSVKNINIAIAITGAVLAVEFTLYTTIRDSSILVPLKYVNLFQLILPENFVLSYVNLNIAEHPVNARVATALVMLAITALAAACILLVHIKKRPAGRQNPIEKLVDRLRKRTYRLVFLQETGKLLFAQRGILVLAVLAFVFTSMGKLPQPTVTDEQRKALDYYKKYAGAVSEQLLEAIDAEIAGLEARLSGGEEEAFFRSVAQDTIKGLEMLRLEVQDIIKRNESGEYPREIKLLPPFTYMTVFGENSRKFAINQGLKALLCIALISAGLYAYERQSSMNKLLRSLPNGRTRLFLKKELLTLAASALVFIAVYLPEIRALEANDLYNGFAYFDYPMQGLNIARESRLPLSVGALTVLVYFIRFFSIFLVGSAVGLLSSFAQRVNSALVLSAAVFVLPACIVAMGANGLYPFTPLPLLFASGMLFYGELPAALAQLFALVLMIAANYYGAASRRRSPAFRSYS